MTKAQRISEQALEEILEFLRPGVSEKEVAAKLTYDMLRFGAEKMSFDPIVALRPNGSLPPRGPQRPGNPVRRVRHHGLRLHYGGYCSDMTRTVAVGEPRGDEEGLCRGAGGPAGRHRRRRRA